MSAIRAYERDDEAARLARPTEFRVPARAYSFVSVISSSSYASPTAMDVDANVCDSYTEASFDRDLDLSRISCGFFFI